jgi:hypothetical protein
MAIRFNWKRFWCPRGEAINLADGGYLCDPDSEWEKYLSPHLIALVFINLPASQGAITRLENR